MPIYNYKCSCRNRWSEFKKVDDRKKARCPSCGRFGTLLIGAPSLSFKGGGFYSSNNPSQMGTKRINID